MYIHSGNMGKGFILLAICPNNNYSNSDQKCAIYEVCPIHNVLSILSRSQCWPTLSRHFVYIVDLLSCLHRPHRNVHRHRVDIVFFFILFHRQHRRNSNIDRHRIDIVHLLSCLYRQHRNVVRHRVYIVPFLRCNQCKFNIGSTSYTMPCGRCKRQRNVSKVDGVNLISLDTVDVAKSTMLTSKKYRWCRTMLCWYCINVVYIAMVTILKKEYVLDMSGGCPIVDMILFM